MVLRFRKSIPATHGIAEMMANLNFEIVAEQRLFTRPSHYVRRDLLEKPENVIKDGKVISTALIMAQNLERESIDN